MIGERLPADGVPQRFVVVADLTRVEEVPAVSVPGRSGTRGTAVLADAWSALFGADAVRPEADFFDLGGTSLLALRLLDAVEQELGNNVLTPEAIFAASTFGELAAVVEAAVEAEAEAAGTAKGAGDHDGGD
jgi:acyl carrier protein